MILRDVGGSRGRHRLAGESIAVRFYVGDVNDRMDAHGAREAEFDSVGSDQLRDGIGTEPSLRELPRGVRKTEIVSGQPDMISDGV